MSLLDFLNTEEGRFGLGLLAAAGPRSDRMGVGGRVQIAMQGQDARKQEGLKAKLLQSQIDESSSQAADRNSLATERTAKMAEATRVNGLIANFGLPRMGTGATGQVNDALPPEFRIGAQQQIAPPQNNDYMSLLRQGVPYERVKQMADAENLGRAEVARVQEIEGPGGAKTLQGFDRFGGVVGQGANGYVAPVSVNQGDRTTFVKPSPGLSLPMNMSPSDRDASARGWAGVQNSRERLAFDQQGGVDGGGVNQSTMIKQFGKPSAGYRWKADGSQEFIPGGPADQKAQLQKSGEGTVGSVVADLRGKYDVLIGEGGIVSTQNGTLSNIGARIGSTGIGQTIGGAVGTKSQSARESIAMTRPLLLQSIMKATGMSAKQMDSNAELKLYLATATDPTMGIEANRQALDRIESLYGGGKPPDVNTSGGNKPSGQAFDAKPPAQQYKGKTMSGPDGKRYTSDGMIWKAVP